MHSIRSFVGSRIRAAATLGCLLLTVLPAAAAGAPEGRSDASEKSPRVALVIGNGSYRASPLDNPTNDARAMADLLKRVGFDVQLLTEAGQSAMTEAVRAFGDRLATTHGVALFYFAGHGVQVRGHNYLIPIDSDLTHEDEVAFRSVDVEQVLRKMETARTAVNIVVLDACRNNPFEHGTRGMSGGLAPMEAPAGSIIAFATAPGAQAADGAGANGAYTGQLLRFMAEPGLKVEDVFKRVRAAVRQETGGLQVPWENTSLEGDFYFVPPTAGSAPAASFDDARRVEIEFWQTVRARDSASDYRAYLDKYPDGQFAVLARGRASPVAARVAVDTGPAHAALAEANRGAAGFSFSAADRLAAQERAELFAPGGACAADPRGRKVRIEIGERNLHGHAGIPPGRVATLLARSLELAGLSVADSAGSADFTLRGTVTTQIGDNRYFAGQGKRVGELSIDGAYTLMRRAGQVVSDVVEHEESYVGANPIPIYLDLAQIQADRVAGRLYSDLCKGGR